MEHRAQLQYLGQARGLYRLTVRGTCLRVTGPGGGVREISSEQYLAVFGAHGYGWAEVAATGMLTDAGPLFAPPGDQP